MDDLIKVMKLFIELGIEYEYTANTLRPCLNLLSGKPVFVFDEDGSFMYIL